MRSQTSINHTISNRTLDRVARGGERIEVARRGNETFYLVSEKDVKLLRELEDKRDAAAARRVLNRIKRGQEKTVPLEEVKRELGL